MGLDRLLFKNASIWNKIRNIAQNVLQCTEDSYSNYQMTKVGFDILSLLTTSPTEKFGKRARFGEQDDYDS